MNGQASQGMGQLFNGAPANSLQPFTTMWPSYYSNDAITAGAGSAGNQSTGRAQEDSSQADEAEALQREREQRILKRKQANRESAKRSKLKRQQAERELQDHARRVDAERDSLNARLAAAQQRYNEAHVKHMDLRRVIQSYVGTPVEGNAQGAGPRG